MATPYPEVDFSLESIRQYLRPATPYAELCELTQADRSNYANTLERLWLFSDYSVRHASLMEAISAISADLNFKSLAEHNLESSRDDHERWARSALICRHLLQTEPYYQGSNDSVAFAFLEWAGYQCYCHGAGASMRQAYAIARIDDRIRELKRQHLASFASSGPIFSDIIFQDSEMIGLSSWLGQPAIFQAHCGRRGGWVAAYGNTIMLQFSESQSVRGKYFTDIAETMPHELGASDILVEIITLRHHKAAIFGQHNTRSFLDLVFSAPISPYYDPERVLDAINHGWTVRKEKEIAQLRLLQKQFETEEEEEQHDLLSLSSSIYPDPIKENQSTHVYPSDDLFLRRYALGDPSGIPDLSPYFPACGVVQRLLDSLTSRLSLHLDKQRQRRDSELWHPDVDVYAV